MTIIDNRGSAPRHVGSSMLVESSGSIEGTIGGGALEGAAVRNAVEAIEAGESRLMDFTLTSDDSANLGMICGGRGVVLIDYVDPGNAAVRGYYTALRALLEEGGRGWAVVEIPQERHPGWTARSCLLAADGRLAGDPSCSPEELAKWIETSGSRSQAPMVGAARTFVQPLGIQGAAYVFGAGHCGQKLVPLLSTVGFYTVVVDDRAEFANETLFPSADRIMVPDSFADVVKRLPIDEDSYVVIVTRGHIHDRTVLRQALETPAGYVGMIGSRRKIADVFQKLEESGVSPEQIARVHAPIGLPIGAETPEEIAVSIAAQLIQARATKRA